MDEYRIELQAYSGPMELLLFLIRKSEVDIYDIPIREVLDQYLKYMEVIKNLDIDSVADFMVMASRLLEIKSRMLLPRETASDDEDEGELIDPRAELVKELLEYKAFRDKARRLELLGEEQSRRFTRKPLPIEGKIVEENEDEDLDEVTVWDLVTAFSKISKEVLADLPRRIVSTDVPVSVYIERIEAHFKKSNEGEITFSSLFTRAADRLEVIGLFLATLEMIKQRRLRAREAPASGDYILEPRDPDEAPPPRLEVVEDEPAPPGRANPFVKSREDKVPVEDANPIEDEAETEETTEPAKSKSVLQGIDEDLLERLKKDTAKLKDFEKSIGDLNDSEEETTEEVPGGEDG